MRRPFLLASILTFLTHPAVAGTAPALQVYAGSGTAIGQAMATNEGAEIQTLLSQWLSPILGQAGPLGGVIAGAMTSQVPAEYVDEMTAVATTLGASQQSIEDANAAPDLGEIATHAQASFGCSSYVVTPGRSRTGAMIVGRNLDYPDSTILAGSWQPIVFAKTGRLKVLAVQPPGLTGLLTAVNEAGVYLAIHTSAGAVSTDGYPVSILFRQTLETAKSARDAVTQLTAVHPTIAANILVADGKDAFVVETDYQASAVRGVGPGGVLYNANHFVVPAMAAHDSADNVPDARWPILQSHDADAQLLGLTDVQDIIRRAGGFNGTDAASNILAVTLDYAAWTLTFASDPSGQVKAIDGARRLTVDLRQAFAAPQAAVRR